MLGSHSFFNGPAVAPLDAYQGAADHRSLHLGRHQGRGHLKDASAKVKPQPRKPTRSARLPKMARLNCMRHFLSTLDYPGKDPAIAQPPQSEIVASAKKVIHRADHILGTALHPETRHVKS